MKPTRVLVTTVALLAATHTAAAAPADQWVLPVPSGAAVHVFDPPAKRWLAGHRGVDLRASPGEPIHAASAGVVTYAGQLAGRGVVVVEHGVLRSTYEPVDPSVQVGERVSAGDVIGVLGSGRTHCAPDSCLHWGVLRGDEYHDPMSLLQTSARRLSEGSVRLLPLGTRALTGEPPPKPAPGTPHNGARNRRLTWPVSNPVVTSPFGMRTHPVTGIYKLHDGTDFSASCGTPIYSAADGVVTHAGAAGAYGNQVGIDHGLVGGTPVTASYSHLSAIGVRTGQSVRAGQVIGWVGTTGSSTGCHLHFMVYAGGGLANPMDWLG